MTVLIVRAPDTQKAMDEVMRRLGSDAYIISTAQSGGMVEMRAARDLPPVVARPTAATAAPPPSATGRMQGWLRGASAHGAPAAPIPHPADPRRTYAVDVDDLADRILPGPDLLRDFPARIILVGPPGGGKSMLAARLAAHLRRVDQSSRPRLIVPVTGPRLTEDRLRGWARLMGLAPEHLSLAEASALPLPDRSRPEIIDLSEVSDHAAELAAALLDGDTEVILTVPAGLHPARLARECGLWHSFGARVCLTRLDHWEPEPDEILVLSGSEGLPLALLADGTGLLDCLRRPQLSDLAHWAEGWSGDHPAPQAKAETAQPLWSEPEAEAEPDDTPAAPVTGTIRGKIGPLKASLARKIAALTEDAPAQPAQPLRAEPPVVATKTTAPRPTGTPPAKVSPAVAAAANAARPAFKLFNRAPLGGTA